MGQEQSAMHACFRVRAGLAIGALLLVLAAGVSVGFVQLSRYESAHSQALHAYREASSSGDLLRESIEIEHQLLVGYLDTGDTTVLDRLRRARDQTDSALAAHELAMLAAPLSLDISDSRRAINEYRLAGDQSVQLLGGPEPIRAVELSNEGWGPIRHVWVTHRKNNQDLMALYTGIVERLKKEVDGIITGLIVALLLVIPASILVAVGLERTAMGRIAELRRALAALARGDLSEPAPSWPDEFGRVAREIDDLRQRLAVVDQERAQLTTQLEASYAQTLEYAKDLRKALSTEQAAVEALKELHAAKNDFAAMVSHELMNPIVTIHTYANLILEHGSNFSRERQQEFVGIIKTQADQLDRLAHDFSTFHHLEAEQFSYAAEPVDLKTLWAEVISEQAPRHPRHNVAFSSPWDEIVVMGDTVRLRQLLNNLLDNAVKFSPGGGEVEVVLRPSSDGREVILSVADRGMGISPEAAPRIFEKFRRALHSGREWIPGTGLGLHVVRLVSEAHGGRAWAEPRERGGMRVFVTLPTQRSVPEAGVARPEMSLVVD